jgi:SAM-dependent methyltransferase
MPIDRYYIEQFLSGHSSDIGGRVLEVKDGRYTEPFGTHVSRSDVLDIDAANPAATIVADLVAAPEVPSGSFDCFVLTQTLQFVYPVDGAVHEARRILRSGGVLLATVPAVSRIDDNYGLDGDFWRFTTASCEKLFGATFGVGNVNVKAYGNVLSAVGLLMGLAREDLTDRELDVSDVLFPVIVGVRAVKV